MLCLDILRRSDFKLNQIFNKYEAPCFSIKLEVQAESYASINIGDIL